MTTWTVHLLPHDEPPAGDVVFLADVESQLLGDAPRWRRVAVVRHEGEPAVADDPGAIVMAGRPMPMPALPADITQPDWSEVAHPPTDDDPAVMIVHICQFEDAAQADVTPTEMEAYTSHAARVAGPAGARIAAWFAVDDTVVGDGRTWHQARFNAFPSKAAFMAVALDPARLEAQRAHREVALSDTYTMILRPTVDQLAASIAS